LTGSPVYDAVNLVIRCIFYASLIEVLVLIRSVGQQLEKSIQERTGELRLEITERLRAEESLRRLAAQLSAAEDVERRKLAYDIHDALSQMLGLVKMNLETVVAETATDSRQFERLSDVVKTVDDLIRQTREMTFDLHPSMLDHFGLIPTLQRFAQDFSRRTHAEVSVTETGEHADLPAELASYLFRAIKELANNAIKHGNAKEIIIAVHWEPGHLRTVVDDDGSGFDPVKAAEPQARRGLGLAGIDERVTSFGGRMKAESQPGNGARIILEVPIPRQHAELAAVGNERGLF
jgi:two-component system sensor histidine kinase DegS